MKLLIKDETFTGDILNQIEIEIANELITVKDLIASRVQAEVNRYNQKSSEYFTGLIQPSDTEKTLNGFKFKKKRNIDAEKQVYVALDCFQKNSYFILIDNIQAESLEQEVLVRQDTSVSFLKLTPLVGG
jgi:hypothetical protein